MLPHEHLELAGKSRRPQRQVRVDPRFQSREAQLLQSPDLRLSRELLAGEIVQRRASPQTQALAQPAGGFLAGAPAQRCGPRLHETLEAPAVGPCSSPTRSR